MRDDLRTPLRHNWGKKKLTGSSIRHSVTFSIFEFSGFRGNFLKNPKPKIGIGSLALQVPMFPTTRTIGPVDSRENPVF